MSVLPSQTNITYGDAFFVKVMGTSTITADTFVGDRIFVGTLSTGSIAVGSISTTANLVVGSNLTVGDTITAYNITATDTMTSYFNNTQYLTSYNGANIHNLLLANQIQGSNLVQFPLATLSSITTTSITLDGNTLDTAGAGIGAELLLNGNPIATASSLTSSILTWSFYPAISNVDMSGKSLVGAATVQGDTANFYNINATNQITFATNLYGATGNLTTLKATNISTNSLVGNNLSTVTFQATTMSNAGTLTSKQVDVTTLNATDITTATLTTTAGGTVTADNGVFKNLRATNGASISGGALNLNGQNITGTNNISAQSASILNNNQVGTLTTGNITAPITNSGFPLYINSSGQNVSVIDYWNLGVDRGADFTDTAVVNINAQNGKYGLITLNAGAGYTYLGVGSPVGGSVVINAQGGSAQGVAFGGTIALNAYSGTGALSNATSKITMNAAGILSWAGVGVPVGSVAGYNYVHGDATVSITAGSITAGVPPVGTVTLYAGNGTIVQNGLYTDTISPRNNGGDLYIQGYTYSGTQRNVRLSNVEALWMNLNTTIAADGISANSISFPRYIFGGTNTNITDLHTLNFIPQIYDAGLGTSINNIQLVHFVDTQNSAIDGLKYITFTKDSGIFNLSTLQVSSINGASFSGVPTIVSTFTDLTTNTFEANTISTGSIYAYTLAGVSSIDGYSIAQLVSSVSPPTPAPSTFLQLYTSSFIANTIQSAFVSTQTLNAYTLSGISSIDGYSIAQLVSSVSPPTPAPSTFQQLYTSSLQADTVSATGVLNLYGNSIGIRPATNYNLNLVTNGVNGVTNIQSGYLTTINSPSTLVAGDLRYNSLFGQPYNPNQVITSSIQTNTVSTNSLTASQILLNGVALSPQVSSFNTLQANQISSGALFVSSIGGYSLSQLVNQPITSTFTELYTSNFGASTAGISYQNSVTLQVSSINGFNVSQFLSTPSPYIQVSTFGQLFTSSLVASDLSTVTLKTSSINGYNISQLLNQPTISSFQQLYTSSLQTQTVSTTSVVAQNLSTFTLQALSLTGISSIDGYSINQLVSSVAPQPPIPSTVLQFFTSSLATNVITNYQTQGVDITAPGYINIHAITGVNIAGDNCNVSITSANKQELISYNTNNYSGNNWTATAQCNVVLNASNTVQIYNTNTAPTVSPNDFAILAEGDLYLNGQRNTTLTASRTLDLLGGLGVILESPGAGDINILTPSGKILLNSLSTVVQHDLNVQTINGVPYKQVLNGTSTFTQLYTSSIQANGITSPNYLQVDGQGILIAPQSNYNANIVAKGTGNVVFEAGAGGKVASYTSTVVYADLRYNTLFGQPYPPPSSWVGSATSDLTMNGHQIINASNVSTQAISLSSINGTAYPPASSWVGTATTDLNMNTHKIYNSNGGGNLILEGSTAIQLASKEIDVTGINAGTGRVVVESDSYINLWASGYTFGSTGDNRGQIELDATSNITIKASAHTAGGVPTTYLGDINMIADINLTGTANYINLTATNNTHINTPSTICSGDIRAATFNGAPLPTGGGGATVSTFNTLYTSTISGNPLNYLTLIANRSITLNSLSTVTNAAGAWFSGDIRAATFNGAPLPSGGGSWVGTATSDLNMCNYSISNVTNINGASYPPPYTPSWVGTAATDLNMNGYKITAPGTLDVKANLDLNLNAGTTSNILTLGGNSVQVSPTRRFEVNLGTTDFQLNGYDLPNTADLSADSIGLRGNSNITLTSPSTIITADLNVLTINGLPPGSGGGWVGTATSDLNMNGYNIRSPSNLSISGSNLSLSNITLLTGVGSTSNNIFYDGSNNIYFNCLSALVLGGCNIVINSSLGVQLGNNVIYQDGSNYFGWDASNNFNLYATGVINLNGTSLTFNGVPISGGGGGWVGTATSDLNMAGYVVKNAPTYNLSNSGNQGTLSLDSNAQLNYTAQPSGYSGAISAPIPLTQGGTARVVVSDTTDPFDVSVLLDYAYQDTSFSVVATSSYATTNVYYPGVLSYAVEISGSNSFNIICRATTTGTYNFNWITTGKYPIGSAV